MLTDEIMYICIKQNIKYAKVQAATDDGAKGVEGGCQGAAAAKYVCMHTNKGEWGEGKGAGQKAYSILLATAGAGDQK